MKPRHLILPLALVTLFACSGEGNVVLEGTSSSSIERGDRDHSRETQVFITLKEIHAHVVKKGGNDHHEDDGDHRHLEWKTRNGKWMAATLSSPKTIDLQELRDGKILLADLDLPEGKITQLRLFLDETGRNEVVLSDGRVCSLRIPSAHQTGIKINKPFKAIRVEDEEVRIIIDFNLKDSVKKDGSCAYKLDPVWKVRVTR